MTGNDFGLNYNLFNIYSTSTASVAIRNMGEFMGSLFFSDFSKTIVKENRLSIACVAIRNMGGIWGAVGGRLPIIF